MIQQGYNGLSHVIVNEKFRVLFCFLPKVSCSNMKRVFLIMDNLYPSIKKVNSKTSHGEIIRLSTFREEKTGIYADKFLQVCACTRCFRAGH